MDELRQAIDQIYAEEGRLNIHDGTITITDKGWAQICRLISTAPA